MIKTYRKALVVALVVGTAGLAVASTALATSATGTQNPDLTVTASLASNGANPDQATNGDQVTARYSVTNNTAQRRRVAIKYTLQYPDGQTVTRSQKLTLAPGQTDADSFTYTVVSSFPRGTYDLTVSARDANGTSSATASITLY